jgi:4-hydroxy-2-oxoheptanedioate aldolase
MTVSGFTQGIPAMRKSYIKEKLGRNEPVELPLLELADPSVFELASLMGFDGLWIDMEHHGYTMETAQNLIRAARVGHADVLIRPAKGEYMRMGRMLESGAHGIMYPRCDDAQEAAEVVKWAKFAPTGKRGFDGEGADNPYCTRPMPEYVKSANEQTFIVIQLEEQHAIARADEIAAVDGVDVIFFGPGDFTVLSGIPGQFGHPLVKHAYQKLSDAAEKNRKHWGTLVGSIEQVKMLFDMGARFFIYGEDLIMVKEGLETIQHQLAELGFTFRNEIA